MPCPTALKNRDELMKEGWEEDWSFHTHFPEQWNDACARVEKMQTDGFYEPVLVLGQTELERRDGVAYIYKKPTAKHQQYEKEMGYSN